MKAAENANPHPQNTVPIAQDTTTGHEAETETVNETEKRIEIANTDTATPATIPKK